jgi:hypothetical protein
LPPQIPTHEEGSNGKEANDDDKLDLAALKKELKAVRRDLASLGSIMHHSGHFSAEGTYGLIKRRGHPVVEASKVKARRKAAADVIVAASTMVQGPDLAANCIAIVRQAMEIDPSIPAKLAKDGLMPQTMVEKEDKRFSGKVRKVPSKIVPMKAAFLFQAQFRANDRIVHGLRELGGNALIDTPEQLQAWAVKQPELPQIKFVQEGFSEIYTPPSDLIFNSLMKNPLFLDTIRWDAQYDKQDARMICWLLVTNLIVESRLKESYVIIR